MLKTTVRYLLAVAAALSAAVALGQDVERSYRVAGTIAIDTDRAFALIESSDGEQQTYRSGEWLDDWEVVDIDAGGVSLQRGDQVVRLPLEGKLVALSAAAVPVTEAEPVMTGTADLDFDSAFRALEKLEKGDSKPLTHAGISAALGLGTDTRIYEVSGQAAAAPADVLQMSMIALAAKDPFRITVSEDGAVEVYLMDRSAQ